jgi:diguanylate cyclase (GGDEF)-like protein
LVIKIVPGFLDPYIEFRGVTTPPDFYRVEHLSTYGLGLPFFRQEKRRKVGDFIMIGTKLTLWSVFRMHGTGILVKTGTLVVFVLVLAQFVSGLAAMSAMPELESVAALAHTLKFTLLLTVPVVLFLTVQQARASMMAEYYRELSRIDPLTGIYNRRAFMDLITGTASAGKKDSADKAILMIDVDHFKSVNDTFGHDGGDAVLVQLAELFRNNLRRDDIVGRLGGEEFAISLRRSNRRDIWHVAQRLRYAVEQNRFRHRGEEIRITVSIGVSIVGIDGSSAAALEKADRLAYLSKRDGRNRITYCSIYENLPNAA